MASRAFLLWAVLSLPGATVASAVPDSAVLEAATSDTERLIAVDREGPVYILPEPAALALTGIGLTLVVWRMKRAWAR